MTEKMRLVEVPISLEELRKVKGADGMQAWVDAILARVPAEFRDTIRVTLDSYGDGDTLVNLLYERPETEAEQAWREDREALWARDREAAERAEYERLKAKFEGS